MRKNHSPARFLLAGGCLLLLLLPGCFKDKVTKTYTMVFPVYTLKTTFLGSINGSPAQPIGTIGKIDLKDKFIYLNEPEKGIHVIDDSDPTHPKQVAFLNIPGNEDLAIKGNTLYADMYRELVAIDISDPQHVRVTGMTANVFPDRYEDTPGYTGIYNGMVIDSSVLLTGYTRRDTTMNTDAPRSIYAGGPILYFDPVFFSASSSSTGSNAGSGTGVAGSMAKMVILTNFLYTISDSHDLSILDVSNAASPGPAKPFFAGYDLETIYPFQNKLFLGSKEGVFIYDISNPTQPAKQGVFTHGNACDPVIADENYAYVTLHAGTSCGGASNELDVVNVQDLQNPVLVKTYPMTKPEGLSKDAVATSLVTGSAVTI